MKEQQDQDHTRDTTVNEKGNPTLMDQVKDAASSTTHSMKETAKTAIQGAREMAHDVLKTESGKQQDHSTSSDHEEIQNFRGKKYSESRQNASLL